MHLLVGAPISSDLRHFPLSFLAMSNEDTNIRIGRAAEMLGVTVDTIRRWADSGRLRSVRSDGGQRLIPIDEVTRLIQERRRATADRPIVAQSARNRFAGVVTRIEVDRVAAVVEILAGPHRLVSLMTAEAVEELGLRIGDEAIARGEVHQRHRRDPIRPGGALVNIGGRRFAVLSIAVVGLLAACSGGATPSPVRHGSVDDTPERPAASPRRPPLGRR